MEKDIVVIFKLRTIDLLVEPLLTSDLLAKGHVCPTSSGAQYNYYGIVLKQIQLYTEPGYTLPVEQLAYKQCSYTVMTTFSIPGAIDKIIIILQTELLQIML